MKGKRKRGRSSIEGFIVTETEKAWLEESDRRWKDIKGGKVKCIPAEKAMKEARANFNRKQ